MTSALHSFTLYLLFCALGLSHAVTVYYVPGQQPLTTGSGTNSADAASYTGAAAYNPVTLPPPALPNPLPALSLNYNLQNGATGVSIPQSGDFFGFSIEMSVANQVLGKNSSLIQVPFLNLLANIQQRAGSVRVRVGGNSQETASQVASLDNGKILEKDLNGVTNPTQTPPLVFTPDLIYMMRNISEMVNVRWFLGIPFNDSSNLRLDIAESAQAILGDYLIGLQAGNEPDLYSAHGHRPATYGPFDYFGEIGQLIGIMSNNPNLQIAKNLLLGPSIATTWTPESVWDTGFVDAYSPNLAFLTFERYPDDNCLAQFGGNGAAKNLTEIFPNYLQHTSAQNLLSTYLNSTVFAQEKGKPLLMFETNTASCGGFPGISDVFASALWGLDYGLLMAASNFSGAMFHVGGQSVYYNPFISPPTNQSTFREWTVGPIYYSALVMAEALGASNKSQVLELGAENQSTYTPCYAIYEDGAPVRMVLINFLSDFSGSSTFTANIAIGGGQTGQQTSTPSQVKVKYLTASSVSQKGNYTWAGQTLGDNFGSDGRLQGTEDIQTVSCDTNAQVCSVTVPAPGAAVVFLTDTAQTEDSGASPTTFSTTAFTKTANTATIDPSVLATSNGRNGNSPLGSSSKGSVNGSPKDQRMAPAGTTAAIALAIVAAVAVLFR